MRPCIHRTGPCLRGVSPESGSSAHNAGRFESRAFSIFPSLISCLCRGWLLFDLGFSHDPLQVLVADGLSFLQLGRDPLGGAGPRGQDILHPPVGPFHELRDLFINPLGGALAKVAVFPKRHGRVEIRAHRRSPEHLIAQALTHPIAHNHLACNLRRTLQVVVCPGRDDALVDNVLGRASTDHDGDAVLQLRLCEQVFLGCRQLQRGAQRSNGARNDRNPMNRIRVLDGKRRQGMPGFVIRDTFLFHLRHHPRTIIQPDSHQVAHLLPNTHLISIIPALFSYHFTYISYMNTLEVAFFFASSNKSRTRAAPKPTNSSMNSEPEIEKKGALASPATARASNVFPVPGGPTRRTPLGMRPPNRWYLSGCFRESTISTSSALASSTPATSENVTFSRSARL